MMILLYSIDNRLYTEIIAEDRHKRKMGGMYNISTIYYPFIFVTRCNIRSITTYYWIVLYNIMIRTR